MQDQLVRDAVSPEHAGYFEVAGAHLYTVLHEVVDPIASVLLVGAFGSERHHSYLAWVRWARYLAARGVEVLRYDYRGIGESTGVFADMRFEHWLEDVQSLAAWLKKRTPHLPLILHGFELGAVLAGRTFDSGTGDGLLLWAPPATANQSLRSTFLRWNGVKQLFAPSEGRKSASYHFSKLEDNQSLRVEGYLWSPDLWRESIALTLPPALLNAESAAAAYKKPVRVVPLTKGVLLQLKGGSIGYEEQKDLDWLFAADLEWIVSDLAVARRCA